MSNKIVNFDLFKIYARNDNGDLFDFGELLLEDHSGKKYRKSTGPVSTMERFRKRGNLIYGTMVHTQMNDLPPFNNPSTGENGELPLDDDQGLGYYTSFIFDTQLQMLLFEKRANGVSLSNFCEFFQKNYLLPEIESEYVLNPSDVNKLRDMGYIKKFDVKIAKVVNGTLFSKPKQPIMSMTSVADDTGSDTLSCTMVAERGKSTSLNLRKIKNMAKALLSYVDTAEVEKLVITGKENEDSPTEVIDLIANRVKIQIKVERTRFNLGSMASEKYDLVTDKYLAIRQPLLKAYGNGNN